MWYWIYPDPATAVIDELRQVKINLAVFSQNDLFMRGLFDDPQFEQLVLKKLCEGFKVREDIVDKDGKLVDVRIHAFGGKDP